MKNPYVEILGNALGLAFLIAIVFAAIALADDILATLLVRR